MIAPIQPLEMSRLNTQSNPNKDIGSKVKKEEAPKFSMEWHCDRCNKYFKVPKTIKDSKITKFKCPYCSNGAITNNYQDKGGLEWEV